MNFPFPCRMRPIRGLLFGVWAAGGAACTPLGLWVYDDPGLQVSRVRVDHEAGTAAPVVLGLALWNPNDFDVTASRLEVELRLDDVRVGHYSRDSAVPVPTDGHADVALPLTVPAGAVRQRIRSLSSGTHRFKVEGHATFSTPFGPRTVRIAHAGDLSFGGGSEVRLTAPVTLDSVAPPAGPFPEPSR